MKTNDLIKSFDGHAIRVVGTAETPLFVAADVCAVQGLQNTSQSIDSLDDDEKGVCLTDTLGGKQNLTVVTESGLYHLIFKSRKESAKRFRRWVTEDVLPSIRRDGFYLPTQPPLEDIAVRADKVCGKMLTFIDQLIRRGVPPTAAAGCTSNAFRDSVRHPSPVFTQPEPKAIAQ
jgi:prophage antirepressor-like protein